MAKRKTPGLPSRKQILDFIATSDQPAGKREIARAFGLHGNDKIALKAIDTPGTKAERRSLAGASRQA